jgi:integrase
MELLVAVCCLAGGLRRSELAGLRWEDIVLNRDEAYIKVQRSIVQVNSQLIEKETKPNPGDVSFHWQSEERYTKYWNGQGRSI